MKIGYARVSTVDQHLDLQLAALKNEACERIFTDHGISGKEFVRPGLEEALEVLSPGDTLIVWRLDRLGRSLHKLVDLLNRLGNREIHFVSITERIDTTCASGRLIFHIMAALAEFERNLIAERTRAGMLAAKDRGIHIGRRRALNCEQCREAKRLLAFYSIEDVAQRFRIHPRTLSRSLRRYSEYVVVKRPKRHLSN